MPTSNIFSFTAENICAKFSEHVSGRADALVCVISEYPLSKAAHAAFEQSMEKLGFGAPACAFVSLTTLQDHLLSGKEVFELIEAIDPLVVIPADISSVQALSLAYNEEIRCDTPTKVFGRTTLGFSDFEALLGTDDDKQFAWSQLKKLRINQGK